MNFDKEQSAYERRIENERSRWEEENEDSLENEHRLEWDELSNDGRKRRMERNYEQADRRRKEIREDELIRGAR
jgi:hypothetical protein